MCTPPPFLEVDDLDLEGRELVSSLANASQNTQFYLPRSWAHPCTSQEAVRETSVRNSTKLSHLGFPLTLRLAS